MTDHTQSQAPILSAELADLRKVLTKVREDINWMLNSQQFLNPFVFKYLDDALAAAPAVPAQEQAASCPDEELEELIDDLRIDAAGGRNCNVFQIEKAADLLATLRAKPPAAPQPRELTEQEVADTLAENDPLTNASRIRLLNGDPVTINLPELTRIVNHCLAAPAQKEGAAPVDGKIQVIARQMVPKWEGEFRSHSDWVNRAQRALSSPSNRPAVCIDAKGRRCTIGADMARARDEGAFPVRYFWEFEAAPVAPHQESAA